jgi:Ca-activated chloride channel family protein
VSFADPYLLAGLLLLPVVLLIKRRIGDGAVPGDFSNIGLLSGFKPTWRLRYRWVPTLLRAGAIALLVIAIARPQRGLADSELPGQGIDIALVLDTSSSMGSGLGDETRLDVAKSVLSEFIAERENDRLGLVIFRSQSLVLSPLTLDYEALDQIVGSVQDVNLDDGTAIGIGLSDALNLLRESRARSRVAILLTDGEQNAGSVQPLEASRIAESLGIRVYTIGVIAEGVRSGGAGVNVDEEALRQMAEVTGGRYFPAESEEALAQIYDSIEELEKSRVGRPQFGAYEELAPYFLAAALLLLALEVGLRSTVWRQAT